MKYSFQCLPNTEKSLNFKIRSQDGKNESVYHITREVIGVWGNPNENLLREFMVSHVKNANWPKNPVTIELKDTPRSLNQAIAELNAAKK